MTTTTDIDDIAVERACNGDKSLTLNRAETAEAFRRLDVRGLSLHEIGERLGITSRTVSRLRSGDTSEPYPRAGATVDHTKEKIAAALRHEHVGIRRLAMRAKADLAKLDGALAEWDAKDAARERVAELERALAEAKAQLRGGKKPAKAPTSGTQARARAWAQEQGIAVPRTGRVPNAVIEQWQRTQTAAS